MEQTASNPRRPLIGEQPGTSESSESSEIFPEIEVVETFDDLDFPVEVKYRNLRMDSYPPIYAVLGIDEEQRIDVIKGQPRLTLQEAMKDAKKWALKERQNQHRVAKELGELGFEVHEDDRFVDFDFLVGRVTSKGLRKLSFARRFRKFLTKVRTLQVKQQRRFLAASVGLQQRLPAGIANGVLKYLWYVAAAIQKFGIRLVQWATLCWSRDCDEGMPVAVSGGHRSIRRKERQKGHRELQSGAAGEKMVKKAAVVVKSWT